jgi:hypothetical protein
VVRAVPVSLAALCESSVRRARPGTTDESVTRGVTIGRESERSGRARGVRPGCVASLSLSLERCVASSGDWRDVWLFNR